MTDLSTQERFGVDAQQKLETVLGVPPFSEASLGAEATPLTFAPANSEQLLGSLIGIAVGEAIGEPVEDRSRTWIQQRFGVIKGFVTATPSTGSDTSLVLLTLTAILNDPANHPQAFATAIAHSAIVSRGQTLNYTRDQLRSGVSWWSAAAPDSAGTAGPARCAPIGLLWVGHPERAGFEAAVSCAVTHGHPSALAAATAIAAAVSTAATGVDLNADWMRSAADVADKTTSDRRVSSRIRMAADLLGHDEASALDLIGTRPVSWETIPAALWCAANATSPIEGVLSAVNAGGDTDTIASMVGALTGAKSGTVAWPHAATQIKGIAEVRQAAAAVANASFTVDDPHSPTQSTTKQDGSVNVSFLLDRSGSMNSLTEDVIENFISITKQYCNQKEDNEIYMNYNKCPRQCKLTR